MQDGIKLIVGLGNPGPEYEDTRHNAGFWFVDEIARAHGAPLRLEKGFHGLVGKANIQGRAVWLLEPLTYMNRSGAAVAALANFYKIASAHILVAHDELDFLPGVAKMKQGGSSGGHNGLKDITAHIGAEYWRLRLGIGHPRALALDQQVVDFVLHRPSREHRRAIDEAIDKSSRIVDRVVQGDMTRALQELHSA